VFPKLEKIDSNGSRVYKTPTGQVYPSVTTITSLQNRANVIEWRNRVGNAEANKISKKASGRGTKIHKWTERYLLNDGFEYDSEDINELTLSQDFTLFIPVLNEIDNIMALETAMFSHELQCAGTVDCIATFKNKVSLIDFKTANKSKEKKWIQNYFMQASAYAHMFKELTNKSIQQTVLLILVNGGETQIFVENPINHLEMFRFYREQYRRENELAK
jgi:genome maintenance exonuclease 1